MLLSSLLFLLLIVANGFAAKWFFAQVLPNAQSAVEQGLGVEIETGLTSVWQLAKASPAENYRWWHEIVVPSVHFILMMSALAIVLIQLLLLFLILRHFNS